MNTRDPIAHTENHGTLTSGKLNWLRAAVLGANDGIVSVASVIVGVAGATLDRGVVLTAGVAALFAGALSMAVGEYVSVSTQRDTEAALLKKERWELDNVPDQELEELIVIYEKKGLSRATAEIVGKELTAHDAFGAHVDAELGIDPNNLTNPWHAALASGVAFFSGAIIPIIGILVVPPRLFVPVTFVAVVVALVIIGALSAYAGGSSKRVAVVRVVIGGALAMAITFGVGKLFGVVGV